MGERELAPQFAVHPLRLVDEYFVHLWNGGSELPRWPVKDEGDFCLGVGGSNLTQSRGGENGIAYPLELEDENVHDADLRPWVRWWTTSRA